MTTIESKLHAAYERLYRTSTDSLAKSTHSIDAAKVLQHTEVNDQYTKVIAQIEEAKKKALKTASEQHLPQEQFARRVLDQKMLLAQLEFEAAMRDAGHTKKLQCTDLQRRAVTLVQTTPELEAEQEEMLAIESRYGVAYEAAWVANQITIAAAKAEYDARVFVDTFHENEVIAIDAKYNAELQQALQTANAAHDAVEERAKSQLQDANDELIEERRKRLAIWQDNTLSQHTKLEKLSAL